MDSLETELERARALEVATLTEAIESIGFECTRCGACCRGEGDEEHTATVFPDEVRELIRESDTRSTWRDVARPMPYGLSSDGETATGVTFEWALKTTACGDCAFYEEGGDSDGGTCSIYEHRPAICQTYPFSVALAGTSQPMGEAVDESGLVRAHECEGLGREIDREDAAALARVLKARSIRELEEAIAVRDAYEPIGTDDSIVVYDSEGAKRADGTPIGSDHNHG